MTANTRLILPPGVKPTADQLSTVHPWDRPGFTPDHLDAEDRVAYWARRQSQIVTATSVSEEVFLTAQAAERIRNARKVERARRGLPQPLPLPKDDPTNTAAPAHAGLQLLGEDLPLIGFDELGTMDEAAFDALEVQPQALILPEGPWGAARAAGGTPVLGEDGHLRVVLDPEPEDVEVLTRGIVLEPEAATLDQILGMEPDPGELSDREILMGLRAKGADVKIKGKSPAPEVKRQPEFNPIEALREQHRRWNATRMNPLAHACKLGVVSLMTGLPPPGALPPRAQL